LARSAGLFTDLMEGASRLRWQTSLTLAVIFGVGFHFLAAAFPMVQKVSAPPNLEHLVIQQFTHVVASIFQWLIPLGFLIGAAVGALKRRRGG
jgi:hypothetical protein